MNTATFTVHAMRLLTTKNLVKPDHAQTLTWKDEVDGWTYTLHASWLYQKGDPDELWHDVHVTARKKGERHTFSVWFEKEGEHYKAV